MAKSLEFYNVKTKKKVKTSKYEVITTTNGRKAAVAISKQGFEMYRFIK